jgi:glycosyltransferase involved in cell wall biosynthesis
MKPCIVWNSILSLEKASKGDISQIVNMVSALAEQKVDVSLVALNAGRMHIDGSKIMQVPRLWYIRQQTRTLGRLFPESYGHGGTFNARHISRFVTSVLDPNEKYDLYHVRTRSLAIELKRLQPNKPLVYTVIPTFLHTQLPKDKILDQKAIDLADELIALTEGWKQYILDTFDVRGREINVIPVCVRGPKSITKKDESLDSLFDGRKVIGYFGRLQKNYGIDTLIETIPEVKNHVNNLSVIIAGGSVYGHGDELKALVQRLGIQDCVHFLGEIPRDLVPQYLERCHVLVSLRYHKDSYKLGFDVSIPIKCVEYTMQGKPIVATRDGGMEQLLGKDYPYLVDHGNKTQIVDSLVKLLTDDEEARKIGIKNMLTSPSYTYEQVASQLINVYSKFAQ